MNAANGLLNCILKKPDDLSTWLMLSDWLEEEGGHENVLRAQFIRLRNEWAVAANNEQRRRNAEKMAMAFLDKHRTIIGHLYRPASFGFRVLAAPSSLAMFMLADQVSAGEDALVEGSAWQGTLRQQTYSHRLPAVLSIRKREGNCFEADMTVDMRPYWGRNCNPSYYEATHYFRGVVFGKHVTFATWENVGTSGLAVYQLRVNRANQWSGTWSIGSGTGPNAGRLCLRPAVTECEGESLAGAGDGITQG